MYQSYVELENKCFAVQILVDLPSNVYKLVVKIHKGVEFIQTVITLIFENQFERKYIC